MFQAHLVFPSSVLESAIPQSPVVPFFEEWCLETKIWTPGVLEAAGVLRYDLGCTELSRVPGPLTLELHFKPLMSLELNKLHFYYSVCIL